MTEDLSPDLAAQLELERRANDLRSQMLADSRFIAGIWEGEEELARNESLTLEEFERALNAPSAP